MDILLSKVTIPVVNLISIILGGLMNIIYEGLNLLGTQKIGFSIIIYTIIVYMIMLPITIRTQKQSKLQSYMQPELSKITKKYAGRRDMETQTKMNEEMQSVYAKYGFSPYGTCAPLLVQMVLLIGVYQVIYHIPGYVNKIGSLFTGLAEKIASTPALSQAMSTFISENGVRLAVKTGAELTTANVVDALYLLKPSQWTAIIASDAFSSISTELSSLQASAQHVNWFLGMNISMSPWDIIKESFSTHAWGYLIIAIAIPVVAWLTQWVGVKLTPAQPTAGDDNPAANSMKTMTTVMPIFSAFICATLSLGVAIYWIVGAVLRAVQMVFINRHMMKWDMEAVIKKNIEKAAKKNAKKKPSPNKKVDPASEKETDMVDSYRLNRQANLNNKHTRKGVDNFADLPSVDYSAYQENPNSMFAKINMVDRYNETHNYKNGKKKKK